MSATKRPDRFTDTAAQRLAWKTLQASGAVIGPTRARAVAAAIWCRAARTDADFWKLANRISSRLRHANPGLFTIPRAWTTIDPLIRVTRAGLDLELDLRDNLQAILYFGGVYEPAVTRFLQTQLRRGDVFVDVGAHIGVHALGAARVLKQLGGGTVFAFEPAADSAAKIRQAAVRNGVDVTVVGTALGAEWRAR